MTARNPCKACQHYWRCYDRDREMLCDQFENGEGGKPGKDDDEGNNKDENEHRVF